MQYNIVDNPHYVLPHMLNPYFRSTMMTKVQTKKARAWLIAAMTELDSNHEQQQRLQQLDAAMQLDNEDQDEMLSSPARLASGSGYL